MRQIKRLAGVGLAVMILAAALVLPALMQPAGRVQAAPFLAGEDGTRDTITPTQIADTGTTMTLSAASGDGHKFVNNYREFVIVTNDYTATITLTVVTGGQAGGHDIADVDVAVGAGVTKLIGPFETAVFNQTSGSDAGRVYLDWDAAVTGTVASSVTLNVYRVQN